MLEAIEINPDGDINACIIWLHGLGADGSDFVPLVPRLGLREQGVRFVFPHAPVRPVTINGGMRVRAWYDIRRPDLRRDVDAAGIRRSVEAVTELVDRETVQFPVHRIVLAGFSQGGVIALQSALSGSEPAAGVLALSTYLAIPGLTGKLPVQAGRAMPIFMGHGTEDPVVPLALGEACRDQLVAAGYPVSFHTYSMAHAVCAEEVLDIRNWLHRQLVGRYGGP
jgi:phospholipase/carboxylesterase